MSSGGAVKHRLVKWAVAICIVALLIFIVFSFDMHALAYSIMLVPIWIIVLLIALQVVTQLLVSLLWWRSAVYLGIPITYMQMFLINCKGAVVDAITPGVKFGGEVARVVGIKNASASSGAHAASVVAVQKLFSLMALFSVGAVFIPAFALVAVVLFMLAVSPSYFLKLQKLQKKSRHKWAAKVQEAIIQFLSHMSAVRKHPAMCARLFALAVLIWGLYPLKMHLLAAQLAPGLGVLNAGRAAIAAYVAALLPLFPGGAGGYEAAMTGMLVGSGVYAPSAFALAIVFRFSTFWFVVAASGVVVLIARHNKYGNCDRV